MAEQPEQRGASPFDAERTWSQCTKLFDFGDRLDFVFLDYTSADVLRAWRRALRAYCDEHGLPWSQPAPRQGFLEWLEGERQRGLVKERQLGARRPREVYLGTIPHNAREGWVLARLNENRDNLVRSLNGVLCLAGEGDFTRRLAFAAPSVWAMKTKTFDLGGPPPSRVLVAADPSLQTLPGVELEDRFDLDVLVSAAPRDEAAARDLLQRLAGEGIRGELAMDEKEHSALDRARLVVVLLSSTYVYSTAWDGLRRSRGACEAPGELRSRLIPVMVSDGPVPGLMWDMTPLDFRTPGAMAHNYARLVSALQGEPEASTGPGLPPPVPVPPANSGWLDRARFDLSDPHERELLKQLVAAYPDHEAVRRVMGYLGIREEVADWKAPLRYTWHTVLVHAAREGRIRELVNYVLSDPGAAPFHAALRKAIGEPARP